MNSRSPYLHRAVARARWLAELAAALDQARDLLPALNYLRDNGSEAIALGARIDALRGEVELMQRLRRSDAGEFHPNWIS